MSNTILSPKGQKKLSENDKQRLAEFLSYLDQEALTFIGYPCSEAHDYSELNALLSHSLNNIGDPFSSSNYHLNSHSFEQDVIAYFKRLTNADQDNWGYVTSGGTEGNLYGLYLGRSVLGDGCVSYYSKDSHYSIVKNIHLLNLPHVMVKSQDNGEMDYQDLTANLLKNSGKKAIININIGTTMKGAIDQVALIKRCLSDAGISAYYLHADAAFFGMILPFIEPSVPFGFETGIDSIAISGHKMIGSPLPCGIVLAKVAHIKKISHRVSYIDTIDNTITGSRSGVTPVYLWYAIRTTSYAIMRNRVNHCFDNADYAITCLNSLGLNAWRNNASFIVVFDSCASKVLAKWQIATQNNTAHLIPMPHINRSTIDTFIAELSAAIS